MIGQQAGTESQRQVKCSRSINHLQTWATFTLGTTSNTVDRSRLPTVRHAEPLLLRGLHTSCSTDPPHALYARLESGGPALLWAASGGFIIIKPIPIQTAAFIPKQVSGRADAT